jgi:hypothetical protein
LRSRGRRQDSKQEIDCRLFIRGGKPNKRDPLSNLAIRPAASISRTTRTISGA